MPSLYNGAYCTWDQCRDYYDRTWGQFRDYYNNPKPGDLWHGDIEEEFGYPITLEATEARPDE